MSYLSSPKTQSHLGFIPTFKKLYELFKLYPIVANIGAGSKFYFLDLNLHLLLLGSIPGFFFFIEFFAVIHDLAYYGINIRYLNQIQPRFSCCLSGLLYRDNTKLTAIFADEANFTCLDVFIDRGAIITFSVVY